MLCYTPLSINKLRGLSKIASLLLAQQLAIHNEGYSLLKSISELRYSLGSKSDRLLQKSFFPEKTLKVWHKTFLGNSSEIMNEENMNLLECYEDVANNTDFFDDPEQSKQFMQCLTDTIDSIQNGTDKEFIPSLDERVFNFAQTHEAEQPLALLIFPLLAMCIEESKPGQSKSFDFFSKQRSITTNTVSDFLYKEFIVRLVSYSELNLSLRLSLFNLTFNKLHEAKGNPFFEDQFEIFNLLRPSQQLLILSYVNDFQSEQMKRFRKTHHSEITDLLAFNEDLITSLLRTWKIKKPLFNLAAIETKLMRYISSGRSMKTFSLLISKQMILLVVILLWVFVIGGTFYNIHLFNQHWQTISEKNQNTSEQVIEQLKYFK
ncbi:MAG: hypothetical protein DRR19_12895 [Candidatus Parabeggiatoa sp. nov. 1]|nr:MAG: hypothetical protein DRR19_12895 [Gammaproteobacteria bacterium]